MRVFPSSKREWIGFALFPFKVYVVIALVLFVIFPGSTLGAMFLTMCSLCAPPLLFGLVIQFFVCPRTDALKTMLFCVPCIVVLLSIVFNQVSHRRFLEREKWKTQTYEMSFDEVVKRLADMEQQNGGKWHWEQKQEYGPNNNILRSYSFVMREHQTGPDSQSDAEIVFQVMVSQWANETNRTRVTEQTTKFGSYRDPGLHQQDLVTETNRIHAVIDAVQGKPWIQN